MTATVTQDDPLTKKRLAAQRAWETIRANRAAGIPPKAKRAPASVVQAEQFRQSFDRWRMIPADRAQLENVQAMEAALERFAVSITSAPLEPPAPRDPQPEPRVPLEAPDPISVLDAILADAQKQVEKPEPKKRSSGRQPKVKAQRAA